MHVQSNTHGLEHVGVLQQVVQDAVGKPRERIVRRGEHSEWLQNGQETEGDKRVTRL